LTTHGTSYLGLIMRLGGVYETRGDSLLEESHTDCKGQTLSAAMAWALQHATEWGATTCPAIPVQARLIRTLQQ
ncbi:hypothetical protein QVM52_23015, partial [Pseudomonas mosselii]